MAVHKRVYLLLLLGNIISKRQDSSVSRAFARNRTIEPDSSVEGSVLTRAVVIL